MIIVELKQKCIPLLLLNADEIVRKILPPNITFCGNILPKILDFFLGKCTRKFFRL